MLALALHYLNGWAMAAADGAKKETPEWPPHPDRVFMALAAAHFESEEGDKDAEREALHWLEALPPPQMAATPAERRQAAGQRAVTHFVPVNDSKLAGKKKVAEVARAIDPELGSLKDAGLTQLPEFRPRQPRSFPVAIPHHPIVHLIWPDADLDQQRRATLAELCRKVTHVGHSASFVRAWLDDSPPAPTWVPRETPGGLRLRVPGPGRLAHLAERGDRTKAIRWADRHGVIDCLKTQIKTAVGPEKRALKTRQAEEEEAMAQEFPEGCPPVLTLDPRLFRPDPGKWQGYGPADTAARVATPGSVFDANLVVLRLSGQRLSLPASLRLTALLRAAIMSRCPTQPPPEWLCGHGPDGRPNPRPHLALLPLAFVGDPHADGRIMGLALALPGRDHLDPDEAAACLGGILYGEAGEPQSLRLFDGPRLDCTLELALGTQSLPKNLSPPTWTRASRRWASVTPVVLERHFDGPDRWDQAAESLKTACERIGLPRPREVVLHPVSLFEGVPRANEFPPLMRKSDGGRMHHSHAVLVFDEPVAGPVLIGAGRFRGYGLCRPLIQGSVHD